MQSITAKTLWEIAPTELQTLLNTNYFKPQTPIIHFYAPSFASYKTKQFVNTTEFPTISVTESICALNCKHCNGKILQTMHSASTPQKLLDLGKKLKTQGAKGVLISGGCTQNGTIPLKNNIPVIEQFKHKLNFTVFVHTGIIDIETANQLKQADIDAALIDVIGTQRTIQKIHNQNITPTDYINSLKALQNAKLNVVPHVIVGLNEGKLGDEYRALEIIKKTLVPAAIVIIAFTPLQGTEMAQVPPPQPLDIAKTVAVARTMFPQIPLALGCMRPRGVHHTQTDIFALKAGIDAIAFPSKKVIEYIKKNGYPYTISACCCAQLYQWSQGKSGKFSGKNHF
ncbi:MAG: radical SAM protein [Nitrososphaerota archaeon]|jgi:uncharacterized radical SAM superfamily protein|nr:radical SAM protein [Nitrososphaerota archaeon]